MPIHCLSIIIQNLADSRLNRKELPAVLALSFSLFSRCCLAEPPCARVGHRAMPKAKLPAQTKRQTAAGFS